MVSDGQLLEDLREFADEIGETPTKEQMKENGPWSGWTYRKHFGSWNEAVKEADLDPVRKYTESKEELIKDLCEFADEIGETPSMRQMETNGPWSKSTYKRQFGSWNEALEEAGLQINQEQKLPSKEQLLKDLNEFADELGETPSRIQTNKNGPWSQPTYRKYFGSWNEALKEAGLQINEVQKSPESKEELRKDLREFADELGETPTTQQMNEHGPWSHATYVNHFGNWNEALKEAELELYKQQIVSKEQLIEDLNEFANEINETPSYRQMYQDGPWCGGTYVNYFGNWNKALKEAGLDPVKEYPIESEWGNDVDNYFGESWPEARRQTLERDEYTCQACGETDSPHVHHITPRRCFEDPDDSNTLDNLITLCNSCHGRCEGRWTELEPTEFAARASELIKKT